MGYIQTCTISLMNTELIHGLRLHFGCDVHFLARGFGALIPSGCVTTLKEPQTVTAVNLLTRIECNVGWFMDKHGVYWVRYCLDSI
jgi:hypothetical protein